MDTSADDLAQLRAAVVAYLAALDAVDSKGSDARLAELYRLTGTQDPLADEA